MFRSIALFVLAAFVSVPLVAADPQPAICNGDGFGITQDFHVGDTHHVNVYHNDCDLAQAFSSTTDDGICAQGIHATLKQTLAVALESPSLPVATMIEELPRMFRFAAFILVAVVGISSSAAQTICNGQGFGIARDLHTGNMVQTNVYNTDCSIHNTYNFASDEDLCISGIFGCSPPPLPYISYTDDGTTYACHLEPNSGSCDGNTIVACHSASYKKIPERIRVIVGFKVLLVSAQQLRGRAEMLPRGPEWKWRIFEIAAKMICIYIEWMSGDSACMTGPVHWCNASPLTNKNTTRKTNQIHTKWHHVFSHKLGPSPVQKESLLPNKVESMDIPLKQSKRSPSSTPPTSSEATTRQPKLPRLDPPTTITTAMAQPNPFDQLPSSAGQSQDRGTITELGWGDSQSAEEVVASDPLLVQLMRESLDVKKLTSGRGRDIGAATPARNMTDVTEKAWKVKYVGNSDSVLVEALHAMNSERSRGAEYNNFMHIVQSSGMGKSRTVDEAAKIVFTLPFNLRPSEDTTAYPPPHTVVRDFIVTPKIGVLLKEKLEYRYLHFFKQLFDMVNGKLSDISICQSYSKLASTWHDKFNEVEQNTLYDKVVEVNTLNTYSLHILAVDKKALDELNTKPFDADALSSIKAAVRMSAQNLLATINSKSKPSDLGPARRNRYNAPVKMILYFDESHELVNKLTKVCPDTEVRSAHQVLCKTLNSIMEEDIFVVHLYTKPSLSRYFPPAQGRYWSHRVEAGDIDLASVAHPNHMVKFGRPLFSTMHEAGHNDIVSFAVQKLFGHPRDKNEDGVLAALSIRLLLEFEPLNEMAKNKEVKLVAGHIRVIYSVPQHSLYLRSGTPSEPLLAEAAAQIMVGRDPLSLLQNYLSHGLISKGERGELIGRLLLTLARDKALKCESVGVIEFLEALIGNDYIDSVKKSRPANIVNGQTLEEAFSNARINFTHFVKGGDSNIVSDDIAWLALTRCMAFVCANGQRTIDLYIPILLWKEKLNRWVVSGIFIQFENCATRERVVMDAMKLGFCTNADPADERAEQYNTRPYITIVMNLGVRPKISAQPEGASSGTPPTSKAQIGLTDSNAAPPKVTTEVGPTRAQSKQRSGTKNIHPRYVINITGYSSYVYGVLLPDSKDLLEGILSVHDILHEHPRKDNIFMDSIWRLKPFWSKIGGSFHWRTGPVNNEGEPEGVYVGDIDEGEESDAEMVIDW
ncbi:hypothetical protein BDZ94DRAFT_1346066 [Collybia nuda]|uniref:Uncharacterized protein n=1 Tax=Collybia nuda TaxID=64659 RepID=A0A9P6CM50_9AGAR|nr:hypothetical protein BDZ94DRAFT_1346066 [Collybia nuda]